MLASVQSFSRDCGYSRAMHTAVLESSCRLSSFTVPADGPRPSFYALSYWTESLVVDILTLLGQFGLLFGPLRTERREKKSLRFSAIITGASYRFASSRRCQHQLCFRVLRALVCATCAADLHVYDRMHCFAGRFEPHMYTDTTATLSSQVVSNDKQQM